MNIVNDNEAVAVAIEAEEDGGHRERALVDLKDNPLRLVMGILKGKSNDKYIVDILNNWYGIKGTAHLTEAALGIPVEAKVQNSIGRVVTAYGAVPWDADFEAEEIETYTDLGIKRVPKTRIKRITSWQ